jgi:hypothetical protein
MRRYWHGSTGSAGKDLAQVGAAIGREFSHVLLAASQGCVLALTGKASYRSPHAHLCNRGMALDASTVLSVDYTFILKTAVDPQRSLPRGDFATLRCGDLALRRCHEARRIAQPPP